MWKIIRLITISLFINCFGLHGQTLLVGGGNYYTDDNGSLYWTSTIAFTAINGTTIYFNIKKLHKYDKYRSNAVFGALSGAAQTVMGFANLNAQYKNAFIPTSINIGVGLTTLVTSVVRLATKNPPKENNASLNFIYLPGHNSKTSMVGLTFKKVF